MSSTSCAEKFVRFLEETTGRLDFSLVESLFSKGLDVNPVFTDIERRGGLSRNIIVVLGGRGCGKTLTIRYIKHRFGRDWDFMYVSGKDLAGDHGLEKLKQEISSKVDELEKDQRFRVAIAIDDIAEASEVSREYLRNEIVELVREYAGRLLLVLAAQSERVTPGGNTTLQLLKSILGRAPSAEMFFGENPEGVIEGIFKNSYVSRNPVVPLRGAVLINLDAYWSNLRSLNKVEELADVIMRIAEFYVRNLGESCNDVLEQIKHRKHGLALLALSSLPKVTDPDTKTVVEYVGEVPGVKLSHRPSALNGLGVAELLRGFLTEPDIANLAESAEKLYAELQSLRTGGTKPWRTDVEDVEKVLLEACASVPYMKVLEDASVSVFGISVPQEEGAKRRRYGPRVDLIEVERRDQKRKYVVVHCLKTDKRGYVMSGPLNKLRELIHLGVPRRAESRYLVVLLPSRKHLKHLYGAVGPAGLSRKGQDLFPLFTERLADIERTLIHLLSTKTFSNGERIPDDLIRLMHRVVLGTVTLSLRDDTDTPQLMYLLLPYISED